MSAEGGSDEVMRTPTPFPLVGDEIVAIIDLKTDREQQKLLMQQWTWISHRSRRLRKQEVEESLERFE